MYKKKKPGYGVYTFGRNCLSGLLLFLVNSFCTDGFDVSENDFEFLRVEDSRRYGSQDVKLTAFLLGHRRVRIDVDLPDAFLAVFARVSQRHNVLQRQFEIFPRDNKKVLNI